MSAHLYFIIYRQSKVILLIRNFCETKKLTNRYKFCIVYGQNISLNFITKINTFDSIRL